ncbi:chemotaxis protein CheW [Pseudoalteromonas sp. YIC-827]|uniref:Chemotaxis protein CheW n=1 Tax=Pseudoalteromonas qingdaonensis TaxID=3131913 RepID=A0ABU9MVN9_9GAMM
MSGMNDKVMRQYLDALLQEDVFAEPQEKELEPQPQIVKQVVKPAAHHPLSPMAQEELAMSAVAQLLAQVELRSQPQEQAEPQALQQEPRQEQVQELTPVPVVEPTPVEPVLPVPEVAPEVLSKPAAEPPVKPEADNTEQTPLRAPQAAREQYMQGEFQALFFEVAGLTLAVPLKSLGGIHQRSELNQLFGKPDWFSGVMLNRDEKINVVDTALWVMPEKYDKQLQQALNYKYVIMLGESQWGLSAETLINNVTLKSEDVKWRQSHGKRPWLAGVIKEKMCALIDVENLQLLLEQGLDSQAQ